MKDSKAAPLHEALSAVADGEASAQELDAVLSAWRQDPALREAWQTQHVLGDGLRSEDLLHAHALRGADSPWFKQLQARLAAEPRVLSPAALPGTATRHGAGPSSWRWLNPAAVAAGFVGMSVWLGAPGPAPEPVQGVMGTAPWVASERATPMAPAWSQGMGGGVEMTVRMPAQAFSGSVSPSWHAGVLSGLATESQGQASPTSPLGPISPPVLWPESAHVPATSAPIASEQRRR